MENKEIQMFKRIFIVLMTLSLISCTGKEQKSISKDDVELLMKEYFEKVKQNNFELIETYYSEAFYENAGKEKWEELYNKVHSTLGSLVSVELESWNVRSVLGTSGSGKYFTFIYKNKYDNGNVTETIILFAPRGKNEVKINSHNYNSEAFLGS
jgi:hypothetical protein